MKRLLLFAGLALGASAQDGRPPAPLRSVDASMRKIARQATKPEVEIYTSELKAEFLLNSAVTRKEYLWARREARRLGVDPDRVPHEPIR